MLPARELLPQEAASTLQGEGEGEGEERRGEGRDGEERRGEQAWESDGSTRPETSITMLRSDILCFTFQYGASPTQWVVPMAWVPCTPGTTDMDRTNSLIARDIRGSVCAVVTGMYCSDSGQLSDSV